MAKQGGTRGKIVFLYRKDKRRVYKVFCYPDDLPREVGIKLGLVDYKHVSKLPVYISSNLVDSKFIETVRVKRENFAAPDEDKNFIMMFKSCFSDNWVFSLPLERLYFSTLVDVKKILKDRIEEEEEKKQGYEYKIVRVVKLESDLENI
jgi:hypothetical protein